MAVITGIHGIAQQFAGGPELTAAWWYALRGGLEAAGFRHTADGVAQDDLRVAYFGDLFRSPGMMGAADEVPEYTASDLDPGFERDLLTTFYEEASSRDPSLLPGDDDMGVVVQGLQAMLRRLAHSRALAGIVEKMFVRDLKQVNWFLDDPATKDTVLSRVHAEVGPDTRIVLGHSLGSVVAYEYLCRYQPAGVELLVTVGSPLGIPNLVFDRLTPRPEAGAGMWPGAVGQWVNVADPDDVVPLVKDLADLFPGPGGTRLLDRRVDNGGEPHLITRYLSSRQVGEAVGGVL